MSKKRILWLINHTTLRNFEVPLLEKLGYEIYLSKIFPFDEANMSASIDYSYDSKLTISEEDVNILNQVNFYKFIPENAQQIINKYFDIVIFPFFPEMVKEIICKFNGVLIFHTFGLLTDSYTNLIAQILGYSFIERIEKTKHRFWFGQGYENLAEVEQGLFKEKAIHLPLGMKNAYFEDKWQGKNNNIFFVCPRINSNVYFNEVYKKFKQDFKEFDYIIGGAQPIKVNDKRIMGFVDKEVYDDLFFNSKVMFYHSQYKRHIHYHPIEAVKIGMPLIFMANGMLDELGGKHLPGRCETIKEANQKIRKIINGDQNFIQEVRKSQIVLLEKFTYEYCLDIWRKNLSRIESYSVEKSESKLQKIAVLLPEKYKGGTLDYIKMLAKSIKRGIDNENKNIEVIFGHLKSDLYEKYEFRELEYLGIKIREFFWEEISNDRLNKIQQLKGYDLFNSEKEYVLPNDGINYFLDCDFWIIGTDRVPKPIAPMKPYIACVHDYIQRYLPNLFGEYYEYPLIKMVRKAEGVLVTTPQTYDDCIQYAGVKKEKVKMIPIMIESEKYIGNLRTNNISDEDNKEDYFIWTTNIAPHKNHINTLKALEKYYNKGGNLSCYVTGVDTNLFDINKVKDLKENDSNFYLKNVREYLGKSDILLKKVKFHGEIPKEMYEDILSKAKFHLHNVIIDNGTFCVVESALRGVPSISSDYPAIRYFSNRFNLNCKFFNPQDIDELTNLIMEAEGKYIQWKQELPKTEEILRLSIENKEIYSQIWDAIKKIMMI